MAHFAELNENNIVTQIIAVNNDVITNPNGVEEELSGIAFCKSLYGSATKWVQTSYSGSFRKRFAGVGDFFNEELDAFVPPRPYASWTYDATTSDWIPPVLPEQNGKRKDWNELEQMWVEIPNA
jgi:hypothetical protein